jgi:hypothetical protein
MNFFRLLPVFISFLLLSAHFFRAGQSALALAPIIFMLLLFIRQSWVPWVIQLTLVLGSIEWLRTLVSVAQVRIEFGVPWMRMAVILGVVALFTAFSSLMFRNKALRNRYSDGKVDE